MITIISKEQKKNNMFITPNLIQAYTIPCFIRLRNLSSKILRPAVQDWCGFL